MAKFRVKKGMEVVSGLSKTLRNQQVPLTYKKKLINNVIIPMTIYGSEIYGMSEIRLSPLQRVVNLSLSHVLGSKKFSRTRAYEELDLMPIQVRSACSRTRAVSKWRCSTGIIKDLITSSGEIRFKKEPG